MLTFAPSRAGLTGLLVAAYWLLAHACAGGEPLPTFALDDAPPAASSAENLLPSDEPPPPSWFDPPWANCQSIEDTYFLRRPWHVGVFFGGLFGDELTDTIDQRGEWVDGLRAGYDYAPNWGWELRSAVGKSNLRFDDPAFSGTAREWFVDANLLHYPWGDSRFRPYWSLGIGAGNFEFIDEFNALHDDWLLTTPVGFGCQYYLRPGIVVRAEVTDTIAFGNEDLNTMHNVSCTFGVELHWHSWGTLPLKYGY